MLDEASADELGAPCAKSEDIFIMLTDGSPSVGAKSSV